MTRSYRTGMHSPAALSVQLAGAFVIGSYYLARHVQLARPRRRAELADQPSSSPATA
jgi:hypothetical protein